MSKKLKFPEACSLNNGKIPQLDLEPRRHLFTIPPGLKLLAIAGQDPTNFLILQKRRMHIKKAILVSSVKSFCKPSRVRKIMSRVKAGYIKSIEIDTKQLSSDLNLLKAIKSVQKIKLVPSFIPHPEKILSGSWKKINAYKLKHFAMRVYNKSKHSVIPKILSYHHSIQSLVFESYCYSPFEYEPMHELTRSSYRCSTNKIKINKSYLTNLQMYLSMFPLSEVKDFLFGFSNIRKLSLTSNNLEEDKVISDFIPLFKNFEALSTLSLTFFGCYDDSFFLELFSDLGNIKLLSELTLIISLEIHQEIARDTTPVLEKFNHLKTLNLMISKRWRGLIPKSFGCSSGHYNLLDKLSGFKNLQNFSLCWDIQTMSEESDDLSSLVRFLSHYKHLQSLKINFFGQDLREGDWTRLLTYIAEMEYLSHLELLERTQTKGSTLSVPLIKEILLKLKLIRSLGLRKIKCMSNFEYEALIHSLMKLPELEYLELYVDDFNLSSEIVNKFKDVKLSLTEENQSREKILKLLTTRNQSIVSPIYFKCHNYDIG